MANFKQAKEEIEPYDDQEQLRKENIGQRIASLRNKIYKHKKPQKKTVIKKHKQVETISPHSGGGIISSQKKIVAVFHSPMGEVP